MLSHNFVNMCPSNLFKLHEIIHVLSTPQSLRRIGGASQISTQIRTKLPMITLHGLIMSILPFAVNFPSLSFLVCLISIDGGEECAIGAAEALLYCKWQAPASRGGLITATLEETYNAVK